DLNTPGEFGPRGIRDMVSNGTEILIVAGPTGTAPAGAVNPFKLFTWDGDPAHAPRALAADLTGMLPEAIVDVPAGPLTGSTVVQLISDNGTTAYYGDGTAAKDLTDSNFKKARADQVTLGKGATDLAVAVSDGVATATPGTPVTYTITVTNNDPSSSRTEV